MTATLLLLACAQPAPQDAGAVLGPHGEDTGAPAGETGSPSVDGDEDGWAPPADCDDTDPDVHPSRADDCDGRDEDCDGEIDEDAPAWTTWYADADQDGFGDPTAPFLACAPPADGAFDATDCDDDDPEAHPGAPETCENPGDDNCDGYADEMVAGVTHATVQDAVDAMCADRDTVWVAAGTWFENLVLSRPVALASVDGPEVTVLDGSACTTGVDLCSVVTAHGVDGASIYGFTLTGGLGHANGDNRAGGGAVSCRDGSVTVRGSVVEGNSADYGGGVLAYGCDAWVEDNVFRGNAAVYRGGAVAVFDSSEARSARIAGNRIEENAAIEGGGVFVWWYTAAELEDNVVTDNAAEYGGGLDWWEDSVTRFSGNTVTDNVATDYGGGIYCLGLPATVGANVVESNTLDDWYPDTSCHLVW